MAEEKPRGKRVVAVIAVVILVAIAVYYLVSSGVFAPSVSKLQDKGDVAGLIEVMQGDDPTRAADAATALEEMADPASVQPLIAIIEADPFSSAASDAVTILAKIGDVKAVPAIISVLETTPSTSAQSMVDKYYYPAAIKALGQLGDGTAAEPIVTWVKERDYPTEEEQALAGEALVALGKDAVQPLLEVAEDGEANSTVRVWAVEVLGEIGDATVAPTLVALLGDVKILDMDPVILSLVNIGAEAVDPLLAGLKSDDWLVVAHSADALGQIGDKRAEADLLSVMAGSRKDIGGLNVERPASDALALINKDDPAKLMAWLDDRDTRLIYYGLIHLGLPETEAALAETLHRYGDQTMAETFLNSGNQALSDAATGWAAANGYDVKTFTLAGSGASETPWGSLGSE